LPIAQAEPLQITVAGFTCVDGTGGPCGRMIGNVTATYTVVGNNGQLPENCQNGSLFIGRGYGSGSYSVINGSRTTIPRTGGTVTATVPRTGPSSYTFGVGKQCGNYRSEFGYDLEKHIYWPSTPDYPEIRVVSYPQQLDVVEGSNATLDVLISGGAFRAANLGEILPSRLDHAVIDWQRSDDGGASWRTIATSLQDEANPLPAGTGLAWQPWRVRHGFVATATDQGALIRAYACYTPPAPTAAAPCATTSGTRLNVLQQSDLPRIVTAPRSVLIRTGQTANFSVTASGAPAPTLQWQTRPANSTGEWTNVTVGTGATTADYTTAQRALSDNGEQYRVVATNAVGSAESVPVTVSVSDLDVAPSISTQPASLSVAAGSDAAFAVAAYGTEALSYQWRFNGADIAGANSPVLRLMAVTNANAGSYTVAVTNSAGSAVSNPAMLSVSAGTPAAVAPSIVTQPASVVVNVGNTATFAVGVDGTGPLTFQWRRDGVNIPGANSASLTFNSVALPNAGAYSVVVSNSAGAVVSNSVLLDVAPAEVAEAPTITSQPSAVVVPPGGSATLAVGVTGTGPLSYQWTFNGTAIPGATLPVLTLTDVSNANVGSYVVRVTNSVSTTSSVGAQLVLLGAPIITQEPAATRSIEGSSANFNVGAQGTGLHYQWMRNGREIPGATQLFYTTPALTLADSGAVYTVLVFNNAGVTISQPAVLTVYVPVPPTVLQQPADVTVQAGQIANLCMAFGGAPPFSVQMNRWIAGAWTPLGSPVPFTDNNAVCISTPPLQLADNGAQFIFFASNAEGGIAEAMTRTVTVTVTAPPAVTAVTLASRASSGATANNRSYDPTLSADGTLVAFQSDGTNLVPGFAGIRHGYVRNLLTGVTTVVNQTPTGEESIRGIIQMKLAAGGRYVVFSSLADDLVADDSNGSMDVFLRDLQTGTTRRLSLLQDGSQLTGTGNAQGDMRLDISADGRYVIFASQYDFSNSGAALPQLALFLRDTQTDQTRIVVANPSYSVGYAALSSDGGTIAYALSIGNPVPAPVQIYDVGTSTSSPLFTLDQSTNADYLGQGLSISGNGRYVSFALRSQPLLGSTVPQIVVIDRNDPATLMIASTGSAGSGIGLGDNVSSYPKLSGDGRYVLFPTKASNISGNVGNSLNWALMLRDLQSQTTSVASRRADGTPIRTAGIGDNLHAISGDGSVVGFTANQIDIGDGNIDYQVYAAPRP
jgi:hypothetical protein